MLIPVMRPSECRVWWADPRHYQITSLTPVLSEVELTRAAGFFRDQDRRRFVTGCWLLRNVVAAQLATTPEAVEIDRRCTKCGKPHGKTRIDGEAATLDVSISHSGDRVAVALSSAGPVGVDVEEVKPDPGGVPQLALAPTELASLQQLSEREQEAAFIRMWVRKEAVLKATGHGLRIPPDQVVVSGPNEDPALLSWPLDITPGGVRLHTLDPGDGYAGAVALLSEGRPVEVSETTVTGFQPNAFPDLATEAA
jgi:4'-phosphopantetheinyl transferase